MSKEKRRARFESFFKCIEDSTTVTVRVTKVVRGGLVVHAVSHQGVQAFLPASHVNVSRVDNLEDFVGQEFQVLVLSCDPSKGTAVVSRKACLLAQQKHLLDQHETQLRVGDVLDGVISSITDRGVFVVAGNFHGRVVDYGVSWLADRDVTELRSVGDAVKARVVRIDAKKSRINFDIRDTEPDPWRQYARSHRVGHLVFGRAVSVFPHCVYFEISPGVYGYSHISEISDGVPAKATDLMNVGDEMWLKIIAHDPLSRYELMGLRMFPVFSNHSSERRSSFSHVNADGWPKKGYRSYLEADQAIVETAGRGYSGPPLYSYLCDTCELWHFGATSAEFWTLSKVKAEQEGGELAPEWEGVSFGEA